MRIFNMARKYKYQEEAAGEGGEGSAGDTGENNSGDQVDDFSNVWHNEVNNGGNPTPNEPQRVVIEDPNAKVLTPAEKLSAHIDSLDLTAGFNSEAMANPETAPVEMQRMLGNAYAAAMKDTNTLITQAVNAAKEEMQASTNDVVHGNQAVNAMNAALSYTKSPAYKPVADSLLTQFQSKGQTPEEAIANVGKYFAKLSGDINATLPKPANNRMQGNGFQGNNNNQSDEVDSQDWMNFLSAK